MCEKIKRLRGSMENALGPKAMEALVSPDVLEIMLNKSLKKSCKCEVLIKVCYVNIYW